MEGHRLPDLFMKEDVDPEVGTSDNLQKGCRCDMGDFRQSSFIVDVTETKKRCLSKDVD